MKKLPPPVFVERLKNTKRNECVSDISDKRINKVSETLSRKAFALNIWAIVVLAQVVEPTIGG